jgi:PAS domain S-box-containing protein
MLLEYVMGMADNGPQPLDEFASPLVASTGGQTPKPSFSGAAQTSRPLRLNHVGVPWAARTAALCMIAILVGCTVLQLKVDYDAAISSAATLTSAMANAIDQHLGGSIRSVDSLMDEVASAVESGSHHSPQFTERMISRLGAFPELRYIAIVNAQGQMQPDTWPAKAVGGDGGDVADRDYFSKQVHGTGQPRLLFGQPVTGRNGHERTIPVSRPLHDANGNFAGIVFAAINADVWADFLKTVLLDDAGSSAVIGTGGDMIARAPNHTATFGKNIADSDLIRIWAARAPIGVATLIAKTDGNDKLLAYRVLDGYPLMVTSGLSRSKALSNWYRMSPVKALLVLAICGAIFHWAQQADLRNRRLRHHQAELERIVNERTAGLAAANKELHATMERLALVLDAAAEGICGVDANYRVVFANRAAVSMLGWQSKEAPEFEHTLSALGHRLTDGRPCREGSCAIHATLADGETRRVEDEFFTGGGDRTVAVEYVVSPHLVDGKVAGAVVVFRDIADRKVARQALEDRQRQLEALTLELERSNRELEHFAYVASHDLREPLRMVSSYLSLLNKRLKDRLTGDEQEFIGFAVDGAKRMDRMINDLLDYSRLGRSGSPAEPVNLDEIVALGLRNLQQAIDDAGARVAVASPLPTVTGHATQLERLFQNLIANAVKFRAPDRVPEIRVACRESAQDWEIFISDNGIGIDPKHHDRLFSIFQRLVTHDSYEGSGIGLAACRKIAENHGGRIWVESQAGVGCTFYLALPKI